MKIAYFDCFAGISGDMTLGALLGAGADANRLRESLAGLGVGGFSIEIGRRMTGPIESTDVRVILEEEAGAKFLMVPFPGASEVVPALLGKHIDFFVGPSAEWAALYKGGKMNVLAVSTEQRDPRFPEVPTFKELGYDVILSTVHWVAAPAGTPDSIVNFLAEAFKKAFAEEAFKEAADKLGATAAWEGPEGSMKAMEKLDQIYQRVVKKFNLQPK